MNSVLKDFKLEERVSEEIINKYKNKVPEQVLDIWQNYGFGSFLNGYLKIVNPEEYEELLKETYIPVEDEPIEFNTVLFATAMGDLIICEKTESKKDNIYIIEYRKKGVLLMTRPFVKWPGGKSEEVGIIHQYIPNNIENYIEPFLGGGACFLSLDRNEYRSAYLNDFSTELISLYRMIQDRNEIFYNYLLDIWTYWNSMGLFSREFYHIIREMYDSYKRNEINEEALKDLVNLFINDRVNMILQDLPESLNVNSDRLIIEFKKSLLSKIKNIKRKELKDGDLPDDDYQSNFE